jgi:hypothetical protein
VVFLAVLLPTSSAHADTSRSTTMQAETLFQQGKALRAAGLDALACAAFEASRHLEDGVGVTLYLADCYESVGEMARARSEFTRAELLAVSRGDPRWQVARRRVDALEPQHPAPAAASPTPREGTEPAPPVATPREAPPPTEVVAKEPDAKPRPPIYAPPEGRSGGSDARRWIGIGMAGAGVVGLAVGTAFGAVAIGNVNESNQGPCGADDRCTSAGLALRQQAVEAARVSTLGFIAGGAALATGIALCVTSPRGDVKAAVVAAPSSGGALAAVAGRF